LSKCRIGGRYCRLNGEILPGHEDPGLVRALVSLPKAQRRRYCQYGTIRRAGSGEVSVGMDRMHWKFLVVVVAAFLSSNTTATAQSISEVAKASSSRGVWCYGHNPADRDRRIYQKFLTSANMTTVEHASVLGAGSQNPTPPTEARILKPRFESQADGTATVTFGDGVVMTLRATGGSTYRATWRGGAAWADMECPATSMPGR